MSEKRGKMLLWLIAALLVLQVISLAKINHLQNSLAQAAANTASLYNRVESLSEDVSRSVRNALSEQNSILDSYDYAFGDFDPDTLTLAMSLTVTPKATGADTQVFLTLGGEETALERRGDSFAATLPVNIFTAFSPMISVETGGQRSHESLEFYGLLKDKILPRLSDSVSLGASEGAMSIQSARGDSPALCQLSGTTVWVHASAGSGGRGGDPFSHLRALIAVDGEDIAAYDLIPEEESGGETYTCELDEDIQLLTGQTLRLYVRGEDEYGLIHDVTLDQFTITGSGEPDWGDFDWLGGEDTIRDQKGRVLWQPAY